MTLDDWLQTIPEDELSMIALTEVWNAAVQATVEALLKEGNLNKDYQESWKEVINNVRA